VPAAPLDAAGEAAALPEGAALGVPLAPALGAAEGAPLAAGLGGGVGANVHPGCAPEEHAARTMATKPMRARARRVRMCGLVPPADGLTGGTG
jgi:hypothetical protein